MRHCLALDLKEDPLLIAEYEAYHAEVWPEILKSIHDSGIESMEIYRVANRLFMIMEVNDKFTFERKALMDLANSRVGVWENLMWKYQQHLPFAKVGEKWVLMEKIFETKNNS
jgi:L-rhamnose mutarotase